MVGVFGGLVVGSGIGGVLAQHWGVTAPFWFAFVGSAVFVVLIWGQLGHIGMPTTTCPRRRGWFHGPTWDSTDLVAALPDGVVVTDPEVMEKYRFDWTHEETAGTPLAVVRAEYAEHVQIAVRWAAAHRIPVVPRGAGSGLSGGSSAVDGGIVVCLERMAAIEIDVASRVAIVEPGALNAASRPPPPWMVSGIRPIPRPSRSARSAATWRRMQAGSAA